jgi:hypothetical protein
VIELIHATENGDGTDMERKLGMFAVWLKEHQLNVCSRVEGLTRSRRCGLEHVKRHEGKVIDMEPS